MQVPHELVTVALQVLTSITSDSTPDPAKVRKLREALGEPDIDADDAACRIVQQFSTQRKVMVAGAADYSTRRMI